MKKMFKFFMTAIIATAVITACSSEEDVSKPEGPNGEVPVVEGEATYATFNFNVQNGVNTKAASITDASELNDINDIRLIIFRTGNSSTCEVNEVYDNPSGPDMDKTKTVLLSSGTKKVFVIANAEGLGAANPFDNSKIIPNTTTLAQFYNAVEIDLGSPAIPGKVTAVDLSKLVSTANGYIMSNAADAGSQQILVGGISETDSREAPAGTIEKNHFKINVLRAVAKAKVFYDSDAALATTDGVGKITGTSLKYGIKNVNRSVNLFQKFSGDMVAAGSTPWAPYYTQTESWTAAEKETLAKYEPYYHREYLIKHAVTMKGTAADAAPSIYFTENTSQIQRRGNSTYAAIEAIFAPLAGKYVATGGITYNATTGAASVTPATAAVSSTGQTLYMLLDANGTTGLADGMLFTDVKDAKLAAYAAQYDHTATPATWDGSYANIPATFNPFETTGSGNTGTPLSLVKTYEGGKCYYRLNFGIGDMLTNNMDYGVWRNYHYQANIKQFGGIGDNLPEDLDIDPEIPLGERTYVTATIIVKDWEDGSSTIIL